MCGKPGLALPGDIDPRPGEVQATRPAQAEFVICDQAIDITYVATREGWLFLAVLVDAYSHRIVGWAMAEHRRAELALDALTMALRARRPPPGLVHHTDRGCQYTAAAYREALVAHGLPAR